MPLITRVKIKKRWSSKLKETIHNYSRRASRVPICLINRGKVDFHRIREACSVELELQLWADKDFMDMALAQVLLELNLESLLILKTFHFTNRSSAQFLR